MDTHRGTGLFHWIIPAMLALVGLTVLVSGRDLTQGFAELEAIDVARPAAAVWAQRLVSLLLLVASIEQIVNHFALGLRVPSATLAISFVVYWLGTVGSPALFGANPVLSHEYLYSLAVGFAALLVVAKERDRIVDTARNALLLLLLAGWLVIPIALTMTLDTAYNQGLIPGVPRMGGLTPHPVSLGMLAQVTLVVLWCRPLQRRWLNRMAWMLGLATLFMAQSKTAWVAFIACAICILLVRHTGDFWRRMVNPRNGSFGVLILLMVILVTLALGVVMLTGDAARTVTNFLDSSEGAELTSMTGRDRIWAAAMEEWRSNKVFGYGLTLWDPVYRNAIGLPNATHAHNQFVDDLARAGSIGATALVLYALTLLVLSLRYAAATGGLSLALLVGIALRSISEVPLLLLGYGTELVTHLLLIITLAAAASARRPVAAAQPQAPVPRKKPSRYGVAT